MKDVKFALNDGDLIGVGCPDAVSIKKPVETFVYTIRAPTAFLQVILHCCGEPHHFVALKDGDLIGVGGQPRYCLHQDVG
jgi:hypothetical protein